MADYQSGFMPAMNCNNCGNVINVMQDPYSIRCNSCILGNEKSILQDLKMRLQISETNLMSQQKLAQHAEGKVTQLASKLNALESAYHEEEKERMSLKVDREHARNSVRCWQGFYEHWRTRKMCDHCKGEAITKIPCPIMAANEQHCLSQTPTFECEPCAKKDATIALFKRAWDHYDTYTRHSNDCGKCMMGKACRERSYLKKVFQESVSDSLHDNAGIELLARLNSVIGDFSFIGEGAAIIMMAPGKYVVGKIDMEKVNIDSMVTLGTGSIPATALAKAKETVPQHQAAAEKQEVHE